MFMAAIYGWTEVRAFASTETKAKKLALAEKKRQCRDDLEKWTWDTVEEYYGANVGEIKEGSVVLN